MLLAFSNFHLNDLSWFVIISLFARLFVCCLLHSLLQPLPPPTHDHFKALEGKDCVYSVCHFIPRASYDAWHIVGAQ